MSKKNKIEILLEQLSVSVLVMILILSFDSFSINIDFIDPIESALTDLELSDLYFSVFRDDYKSKVDTNIVVINMGEEDRKIIAEAITKINSYEPKVIGLDAFFISLNDNYTDTLLRNVFNETKKIVLVSQLKKDNLKQVQFATNSFFTENVEVGFANLNEDSSFRTVRKFKPYVIRNNDTIKSFSLQIANHFNPNSYKNLLLRNNEFEIINFIGDFKNFFNLDIRSVIKPEVNLNFLKNKIVLIGYLGRLNEIDYLNFSFDKDKFFTPLNKQYVGRSQPDMYGTVIHANIISMIIRNDYIQSISTELEYLCWFILYFLNSYIFSHLYYSNHDLFSSLSKLIIFFETIVLFFLSILFLSILNLKVEPKIFLIGIFLLPDLYESFVSVKKKLISLLKKTELE